MSQFYQGVSAGSLPPSVPTSFLLDDGNSAVALASVVKVNGGVGVETELGASNQIIIRVESEGFGWSEQNADFSASIQNGYFCNVALTATLPDTTGLVIGNTIIIYVDTASAVIVQAASGQSIQIGSGVSTSGGTATCTAGQKGSILELVFKPSDLTWHTQSSIGSWVTA